MTVQKGRLITVWVPGNHGAGGSTITDAIGIAIQYLMGFKAIIVNFSGKHSYMERFLENDINIKYSMDYLKGFGQKIDSRHIEMLSTHINDKLSIIPGNKLKASCAEAERKFEQCLLQKCIENYDIVVADIESGIKEENKLLLDMSDIILAVMTPNEIMLDDIFKDLGKSDIVEYLRASKTIPVFNMMGYKNNIAGELKRLSKKYDFEACFGISTDDSVFEACCKHKRMYTYMVNGLEKELNGFPRQIEELCIITAERLEIPGYSSRTLQKGVIQRLLDSKASLHFKRRLIQ